MSVLSDAFEQIDSVTISLNEVFNSVLGGTKPDLIVENAPTHTL